MAYGSEEYYNQTPQVLDMLNRQSDRQRSQIKDAAADTANTTRETGYNVGNAIGRLPKDYQESKKRTQDYRASEEQMAMDKERNKREGGDYAQRQKMNDQQIAKTQAEEDFLNAEVKPGLNRRQQGYEMDFESKRLGNQNQQLTAQQFRQNMQTHENEQTDRKVARASSLFEGAVASNDPQKMHDARVQAQKMGLNGSDIALAENTAKKAVASGQASANMIYNTTPEGAATNQTIAELSSKDFPALAKLESALSTYRKEWNPYSETARTAKADAMDAARALGIPESQLANIDDSVMKERSIQIALTNAKQSVAQKVSLAKRTAGPGAPPSVKASIQNLDNALADMGSISGSKTNIFNGQQAPGAQTTLVGALSGGGQGQPQQGGMQPPPGQPGPMQGAPMDQQRISPFRQNARR